MSTLITPECSASGCPAAGDQYTMVHCRVCGAWVCPEHTAAEEGVTLRRYGRQAPRDLRYYQGLCLSCATDRDRNHLYLAPGSGEAALDTSATCG